jgi:Domain of unknown function (DUF6473)
MYQLEQTSLSFRGPPPESLAPGEFVVCAGAAQTYGCFCEAPYPKLLSDALGLPTLNLGYGGAGPEFFLRQSQLHAYFNKSRFVILQVMSGRSQSNSLYECDGLEYVTLRDSGRKMSAAAAFNELFHDARYYRYLGRSKPVRGLAKLEARPVVRALVEEIRAAWVESYVQLIESISVPVVLFWFSKRESEYALNFKNVGNTLGEYPQLINREMVEEIRGHCEGYVECVSLPGVRQGLFSRTSGEPVTVNPANNRMDLETAPWRTKSLLSDTGNARGCVSGIGQHVQVAA